MRSKISKEMIENGSQRDQKRSKNCLGWAGRGLAWAGRWGHWGALTLSNQSRPEKPAITSDFGLFWSHFWLFWHHFGVFFRSCFSTWFGDRFFMISASVLTSFSYYFQIIFVSVFVSLENVISETPTREINGFTPSGMWSEI